MRSRREGEGAGSSPNLCQCRVISKGFGESGGSLVTDIIITQPEGRARRNEIEKGGGRGESSHNLCQCRVISKGFGESGGSLGTDIITNQPEGRARRNEIEKGGGEGRELT
jgi:hypothetical protein